MTQLDQPLSQNAPDTLSDPSQQLHDVHPQWWSQSLPSWLQPHDVNVGQTERAVSVVGGAALAALGLSRGTLGGLVAGVLGGGLMYRGLTGHCQLYKSIGVNTAQPQGRAAEPQDYFDHGIHVEQSFTINKTPWELYAFWRDFKNLPRIMSHLESVQVLDDKRSHWVAKAPSIAGGRVEWDAEIINDEPNALIAWRSLGNADVDNAGSVRFVTAPGDRGTEVKVVIDYIPPAGRIGRWVAKLFGEEPQQQIMEDLRKFKRVMETGEFATTKGQPRGSCDGCGHTEE